MSVSDTLSPEWREKVEAASKRFLDTPAATKPKTARPTPTVAGAPFHLTAEHFAVAIIAAARSMDVSPVRALTQKGRESRAIAPAMFALSSVTGAPFVAVAKCVGVWKTDAYKSRKRADDEWSRAQRAAEKAVARAYHPPRAAIPKLAPPPKVQPVARVPVEFDDPMLPAPPAPVPAPVPEILARPVPVRTIIVPDEPRPAPRIIPRVGQPRVSMPPARISERALSDRILDLLGNRALSTRSIATILGTKELPVGDCLRNLQHLGRVNCEEFLDGHLTLKRWSVAQ